MSEDWREKAVATPLSLKLAAVALLLQACAPAAVMLGLQIAGETLALACDISAASKGSWEDKALPSTTGCYPSTSEMADWDSTVLVH